MKPTRRSDHKRLAFGYVRVSDPRQVQNTSLRNQEEEIRRKASEEGYTLEKVFIEGGKSASAPTSSRQEFHRMLSACEEQQETIGAVIVWKYDRFARNPADHYSVKVELLSMGIRLISVREPSNETLEGELIEGIMASVARVECRQLSLRCKDGIRRIREQGRLSGPAPIGYLNVKQDDGGRTVKSVAIDPERGHLIRTAFELYSAGTFTCRQVADKINQLGFTMPRSGKPLLDSRVSELLRNPVYAGRIYVDPDDDTWVKADFPAIVHGTLFDKVQRILEKSTKTQGRTYKLVNPAFPLKRFVRCALCGGPLTGGHTEGNGGGYDYYRCYNPLCYGTSERKELLEESFSTLLDQVRLKPDMLRIFKAVLQDVWNRQRGDSEQEISSLRAQQKALIEKQNRLLDLYCAGKIGEDVYSHQQDQYRADLLKVDERLAGITTAGGTSGGFLNHAADVLGKASILWTSSNIDGRIRLQDALFPDGVLYESEDGFLNPPMSKAFSLLDMLNASDSALVAGTGFEPVTFGL